VTTGWIKCSWQEINITKNGLAGLAPIHSQIEKVVPQLAGVIRTIRLFVFFQM
jgi:hypothetical protein